MIVALGIPAYRQQIHVRTAYAWLQDSLTAALDLGWRPLPLFVDCSGIARARNRMVQMALDGGARMLLMCDSDTFPTLPEGGLGAMASALEQHQAAAIGAAVVVRNDSSRVNCEPYRPGEVYEGEVGTGYMLLDLWRLRDVPRPWFRHADTDDGMDVLCGEDIHACRLFRQHGHRVLVHAGLPTGHADQSIAVSHDT